MVFYSISAEDWEYFTNEGFLAIPVWGGFCLKKIGYMPIFVDHESPAVKNISEVELDRLVQKLDLYQSLNEIEKQDMVPFDEN